MKKTIFAIVLLSAILGAGIWEAVYIDRTFKDLDQQLTTINKLIADEKLEEALDKTNKTLDWWEDKRKNLEIFTYNSDMRQLSVCLGEAVGSLKIGDSQNALSKTQSTIVMANNIKQILDFNIQDIF